MLTPAQARMARAALKWSVVDLQKKTGINKNTIVRFEAGREVFLSTAARIEEAFRNEGIIFTYESSAEGLGIQLSKELLRRLEKGSSVLPRQRSTKHPIKSKTRRV